MTDNDMHDKAVSAAYRDGADEQSPAALDAKILAEARQAVRRKPYPMWLRPVAWAATIALSLGIVLEMSQQPPVPVDAISPAPSIRQEFTPKDQDVLKDAADLAATRDGDNRPDRFESRMRRQAAGGQPEIPAEKQLPESVSTNFAADPAFEADLAESELQKSGASSKELKRESAAEQACHEDERAEAADWLACIADLRQQGRDDDANMEREQFRLEFPGYVDE